MCKHMNVLFKSSYVEIEERQHKNRTYYAVWFYDGNGKLIGFTKKNTKQAAIHAAFEHVNRRLGLCR